MHWLLTLDTYETSNDDPVTQHANLRLSDTITTLYILFELTIFCLLRTHRIVGRRLNGVAQNEKVS